MVNLGSGPSGYTALHSRFLDLDTFEPGPSSMLVGAVGESSVQVAVAFDGQRYGLLVVKSRYVSS